MRRSVLADRRPVVVVADLASRARGRLARHRAVARLAVAACVASGAWVGWSTLAAAAERRDAWGTTTYVAVAARDLVPGAHAGAANVTLRAWPAALVPPSALREVPDATVRQHVSAGEPLGAADIGAADGPAGLLAPGTVAVAVPVDDGRRPPLATMDRVGVIVDARRVAGGDVVTVAADHVVIAVPAADAGTVVTAALDGAVGLTLEPPG